MLAPDQTCNRCQKPAARHEITPLGAVVCLELPRYGGLTPWHSHGFMTKDGLHYLSLMEQIGALAGMLEERGLVEGHDVILERIVALQLWMNLLRPGGSMGAGAVITIPRPPELG
jgi:hypothetical protein